jgi:hypothetical protein
MEFKTKIKTDKQGDSWLATCPICQSKWSTTKEPGQEFQLIAFCEHLSHAELDVAEVVFVIVRKDGRFWRRHFDGF